MIKKEETEQPAAAVEASAAEERPFILKGHTFLDIDKEYDMLMSAMKVSVSKHIMSDDFTVIWANDFYYSMTGYTKEEYEEKFHNSVREYYADDLDEFEKLGRQVLHALKTNQPGYTALSRMPTKTGHIWIRVVGTFTDEIIGGFPVLYSVFTDITEVIDIRTEQNVTFNNIPGFVAKFRIKPDMDFEFIECNEKFIEFFGKRGPKDRPYCILNCHNDENRAIIAEHYADMRAGKSVSFTARDRDAKGNDAWLKINADCIDKKSSDPVYLFVYIDITDLTEQRALQKKLEKQSLILQAALDSAEKANAAKSTFLSRMSHDIRTPMNAILGMAAIAKTYSDDPVQVMNCLNKLEVSAKFLLSLINDILDMSKIESGKMTLSKRPFDFVGFLHDLTVVFYSEAQQKKISFNVGVEGNIRERYLGDELKLKQILINLLGNAIKFTDSGGRVDLRLKVGKQIGQSAELIFIVEDDGIGMDEDFQSILFRPFEQAADQNRYGGTGLGLAIAQSFAKMMNGEISVKSRRGVGSSFTLRVWLDIADSPDVCGKYESVNVVVVENNEIGIKYAGALIEKFGVNAEVAGGAEEALAILERTLPGFKHNLLITSWGGPGVDGEEIVRRVREVYPGEALFIAVNALETETIKRAALSAGADLLVPRPMFPSTVNDLLMTVTGGKSLKPAEGVTAFSFDGQRVLLVEDNEINLEIATILLERANLTVDSARNGKEAAEKFAAAPVGSYSLILMDIQMPVMDGFEATKAIRTSGRADALSVPIVAMSANAFDEDVRKSLDSGMDAHISKPVDLNVLRDTLTRIIK